MISTLHPDRAAIEAAQRIREAFGARAHMVPWPDEGEPDDAPNVPTLSGYERVLEACRLRRTGITSDKLAAVLDLRRNAVAEYLKRAVDRREVRVVGVIRGTGRPTNVYAIEEARST